MSAQTISVKKSIDGIATITLNRPQHHNAINLLMIRELTEALQSLKKDIQLRALILKAEGKTFCSGADLTWMKESASYSEEKNISEAQLLANLLYCLNFFPTPVICVIQGNAYGGALGLIACADIAICSEHSTFRLSEVRLGLVPAVVSPYIIAKIGQTAARRYFLTAESFNASRACQIGLINEAVPPSELQAYADTTSQSVLCNGPQAIQVAKQLIFDIAEAPINSDLMKHTSQLITERRTSIEGQEGLNAFFEERPPKWRK